MELKYKDKKILDFSKKNKNDIDIILGANGSGKTKKLEDCYRKNKAKDNNSMHLFFSDSYLIKSGQVVKYIISNTDINSIESTEISEKSLKHINALNAKVNNMYKKIEYKIIDYDIFTDIFGNEISEINILFDEYDKDIKFLYIQVTDSSGVSYDSLSMGRGEYLAIVYFILFEKEISNSTIYIDEPCNYLSYFSLQNLSRLLIKSSYVKNNKFYLTTNNLDIVDNFINYRVKLNIIFNYSDESLDSSITLEDFYLIFKDRYNKTVDYGNLIFVEDILAKKFLDKLFPHSEIVFLSGESKLQTVESFYKVISEIPEDIKNRRFPSVKFIYDGDQEDRDHKLPFDNIESYVNNNYELFSRTNISESVKYSIQNSIATKDLHDAYLDVLTSLEVTEDECLNILVEKYKDSGWYSEVKDYLNQ